MFKTVYLFPYFYHIFSLSYTKLPLYIYIYSCLSYNLWRSVSITVSILLSPSVYLISLTLKAFILPLSTQHSISCNPPPHSS